MRKDIMIMDRYLNSITKKPEVKLSDSEKGILKDELKNVRKITDYSPKMGFANDLLIVRIWNHDRLETNRKNGG